MQLASYELVKFMTGNYCITVQSTFIQVQPNLDLPYESQILSTICYLLAPFKVICSQVSKRTLQSVESPLSSINK